MCMWPKQVICLSFILLSPGKADFNRVDPDIYQLCTNYNLVMTSRSTAATPPHQNSTLWCLKSRSSTELFLHHMCANVSDSCGFPLAGIKCCVLFQRMRVSSPSSRTWTKCSRSVIKIKKKERGIFNGCETSKIEPHVHVLLSD